MGNHFSEARGSAIGFEILNIGLEIQESFDFEISDFPILY
jgi:hypothetical protein